MYFLNYWVNSNHPKAKYRPDQCNHTKKWSHKWLDKDYQSSQFMWTMRVVETTSLKAHRHTASAINEIRIRQRSMHKKPDKTSTYSKSFQELNPGQPIGVDFESPHHQVEDFFMLSDNEWAISSVELLDLLKLYFTNFCQLAPDQYNYHTAR